MVLDYNGFNKQFNVPLTLGGSLDRNGDPWRYSSLDLNNTIFKVQYEKGTAVTLPTPVKYGSSFDGWYVDNNTFQTQVTASYIPQDNIPIYVKYIQTVNSMLLEDTNLYMIENGTKQINITNESTIEETYEFASNNTEIATVSNTGLVTATGTGDAIITITGNASSETKQVNVHVSNDNNIIDSYFFCLFYQLNNP